MKNKGLPTQKEWDNIIDEAFSSDEKHDFSALYELRKAEIQKGITMKKTTNHIQRRYRGMVAAAAAIVIAAPASVYALSKALPTSNMISCITQKKAKMNILSGLLQRTLKLTKQENAMFSTHGCPKDSVPMYLLPTYFTDLIKIMEGLLKPTISACMNPVQWNRIYGV